MPAFHIPGYNYAGPGTHDYTRKPVNKLDRAARLHDLSYRRYYDSHGNKVYYQFSPADERFINASRRIRGPAARLSEYVFRVKRALAPKMSFKKSMPKRSRQVSHFDKRKRRTLSWGESKYMSPSQKFAARKYSVGLNYGPPNASYGASYRKPYNSRQIAGGGYRATNNHNRTYAKISKRRSKKRSVSKLDRKIKNAVAKPDWSTARVARSFGIRTIEAAVNKVDYSALLTDTYAAALARLEGTDAALSYHNIVAGADVAVDMVDISGATKFNKLQKYRCDVNCKLKNVSNSTSLVEITVYKCKRATGFTPFAEANVIYQAKQDINGASLVDDHWYKVSNNLNAKGSSWGVHKNWQYNISAGETADCHIHIPWDVINIDEIFEMGLTGNTFQKGMYYIDTRICGVPSHGQSTTTNLGYAPASVVLAFDIMQYASYQEGDVATNKTQTRPSYTLVTSAAVEPENPGKGAWAV